MSGSPVLERLGDGEATAFTRLPYHQSRGLTYPAPSARPTSPGGFPKRLSSEPPSADSMFSNRNTRLSLQNRSNDKGKAPLRGGNADLSSMNDDPFATYDRVRSPSLSSTPPANGFSPRKNRNSIISAASDALSFKFGRKTRPAMRQAPGPIILPDVIEISAPPPDHEVEERSRLREMAAQAIGISPLIVHRDSYSQEESTEDEDEIALRTPVDSSELRRFGDNRNSESVPDIRNKSFLDTSSINSATNRMRFRSGSVVSHSLHNSIAFTPIPPFPTNVLSLNPFLTCSAYFPKYTQPSSLRRFALTSKSWKPRYIILSTASNPRRNPAPAVSYLHLFKSSGPDDKELERLEIHADSAVFVADEEIGGRRNIIRIKGVEVVPGRSNNGVHEATWQLHIADPVESQKWISTIKSAILGQRTIAAGLVIPQSPTGTEPRGDLDVILKMRIQGLATSQKPPSSTYDVQPSRSPTDPNYASSISSQSIRSQATVPKFAPSGTVSVLRGFFSSRPRSGSRATTVDSERQPAERDHAEDSFASMGSNLLGMLRSNTPDIQSNLAPLSAPVQQRNSLPFAPYSTPADRKVLSERQPEQWIHVPAQGTSDKNRANRALSLGALSLQPPPRKRWTSLRPTSDNPHDGLMLINSDTVSTNVLNTRASTERPETEHPYSPTDFSTFSMEEHSTRPRAPSLQSVSTYGSENTKKSSSSTKRTSKRWSRQLPQRLTPPSGPPPAIPPTASATQLHVHPSGLERPPSTLSTTSGVVADLPMFSKRASTSSSRSENSTSTTPNSASSSSSNRAHRASMPPPPRPAPTSALPLAPDHDATFGPSSSAGEKTIFRNSVAQRALRLSMIAPKPPPSSNLPPRPDEFESIINKKHHRRSSSSARSQTLDTIPEPSKHPTSPFPPPRGPLPPTPSLGEDIPAHQPPVSRHSSLKQRLRILSAPSPSNGPAPLSPRTNGSASTTPTPTPFLMQFTHSTPPTPTTEKMWTFSHDQHSFLQLNTTPTPANLLYRLDGFQDDSMVELLGDVTPLAPPPRRGSKQMSIIPEPLSLVVPPTLLSAGTSESTGSAVSDQMVFRSGSISTQDDDEDEDDRLHHNDNNNDNDEYDDDDKSMSAEVLSVSSSRHLKLTPTITNSINNASSLSPAPGPLRVFSLSPLGSVVSLGVVGL